MTEPVDIYIATTIIRLGFGVLFLAAGVSKLLRLGSVEHILARYRLLPDSMLSMNLDGPAPQLYIKNVVISAQRHPTRSCKLSFFNYKWRPGQR